MRPRVGRVLRSQGAGQPPRAAARPDPAQPLGLLCRRGRRAGAVRSAGRPELGHVAVEPLPEFVSHAACGQVCRHVGRFGDGRGEDCQAGFKEESVPWRNVPTGKCLAMLIACHLFVIYHFFVELR